MEEAAVAAHLAGDGASAAGSGARERRARGRGRGGGEAAKEAETSSQGQSAPAEWRLMASSTPSPSQRTPPRKRGSAAVAEYYDSQNSLIKRTATFGQRRGRAQAPGPVSSNLLDSTGPTPRKKRR